MLFLAPNRKTVFKNLIKLHKITRKIKMSKAYRNDYIKKISFCFFCFFFIRRLADKNLKRISYNVTNEIKEICVMNVSTIIIKCILNKIMGEKDQVKSWCRQIKDNSKNFGTMCCDQMKQKIFQSLVP